MFVQNNSCDKFYFIYSSFEWVPARAINGHKKGKYHKQKYFNTKYVVWKTEKINSPRICHWRTDNIVYAISRIIRKLRIWARKLERERGKLKWKVFYINFELWTLNFTEINLNIYYTVIVVIWWLLTTVWPTKSKEAYIF